MDFLVICFGGIVLFSTVNSISPAKSLRQIAVYCIFIGAYFVMANLIKTRQFARKSAAALLIGAALASVIGIYQNIVGLETSIIWVDTKMFAGISQRVIGPFDNPNVFGEYLVTLLPLACAMFFVQKKYRRLAFGAVFGLMTAALVYTYSRGAGVAGVAGMLLFLVLYSSFFIKLLVAGAVAIPFIPSLIPSLLPANIVARFSSIGDTADTSTAYRLSIWRGCIRMIKDIWPRGIGPGSGVFLMVYPSYALSGAMYALHAHNLYLQIVIDYGLVGGLVFGGIILSVISLMITMIARFRDRELTAIALALGCGIISLMVQALTDNVFFNFKIVLLFWAALGVAAGVYRAAAADRRAEQ